jgi:RND family efflux transporter MFP subunit
LEKPPRLLQFRASHGGDLPEHSGDAGYIRALQNNNFLAYTGSMKRCLNHKKSVPMDMNSHFPAFASRQSAWVTCLSLVLLAACSKPEAPAPAAAASAPATAASGPASAPAQTGGPVSVVTVKAIKRDVPISVKAVGSVVSLANVDIRPQLTSTIMNVHFKEGQFVKEGDLLFSLDTRTDEANLLKAKAQLAKDQAALNDAKRQLQRSQDLVAKNFVSAAALDTAQLQVESQAATVAADAAAVQAAQVAVSYGRIVAPFSGRLGALNSQIGSVVQANITVLVNLVKVNPIAVSFAVPQSEWNNLMAAQKNGAKVKIRATLPDQKEPMQGRLEFIDNNIDANSGTLKLKAVFDNPDSKLWVGQFANMSMDVGALPGAIVVPQAAIVQTARGSIVYAVVDGKAALKPVKILYSAGAEAVVSGVEEGMVVVTDGKQNLRPGSSVVERQPPAAAKADASAPAKADAAK